MQLLTDEFHPDFTAVGEAGFEGCVLFAFEGRGLYVLESFEYGNATCILGGDWQTVILGGDWQTVSQRTKKEILEGGLHKSRIVHAQSWERQLRQVLA